MQTFISHLKHTQRKFDLKELQLIFKKKSEIIYIPPFITFIIYEKKFKQSSDLVQQSQYINYIGYWPTSEFLQLNLSCLNLDDNCV